MTRTETPTPFAEGQRNADILTMSHTLHGRILAYAEHAGRIDELIELHRMASRPGSRWSSEARDALLDRSAEHLRTLYRIRDELIAAGGDLEPWETPERVERDLGRCRGAA